MIKGIDVVKNMFGWKGKEEFVENTQKKKVLINPNGDFENGKVIYIEAEWSLSDFLIAASNRLNIPTAKIVFNGNGMRIDDVMMVEDDDILFLSSGNEFIQPQMIDRDDDVPDSLRASHSHPSNDDPEVAQLHKPPTLVGSYKVGAVLGRGGFGEVRVGIHQFTGEKVALKFMRKSEIQSIGAAERTATEIQCLTTLQHPNIIRLQQHIELAQFVCLVFELMEGGDLNKFLCNRGETAEEMSLPEDEARSVFQQVLAGVSFAHNQHICHRDLKLENILLKEDSINVVKIADFGLSGFYRPGATMKSNCGTLSFLAPEVFKGTANAGPPLDVWALGVVLFAILCGRLPFEGTDLTGSKRPRDNVIMSRIMKCQYKLDERLSPEAKDLVRRMLKSDPGERASIPEVFSHVWLRCNTNMSVKPAGQSKKLALLDSTIITNSNNMNTEGGSRSSPSAFTPTTTITATTINAMFESLVTMTEGDDATAGTTGRRKSRLQGRVTIKMPTDAALVADIDTTTERINAGENDGDNGGEMRDEDGGDEVEDNMNDVSSVHMRTPASLSRGNSRTNLNPLNANNTSPSSSSVSVSTTPNNHHKNSSKGTTSNPNGHTFGTANNQNNNDNPDTSSSSSSKGSKSSMSAKTLNHSDSSASSVSMNNNGNSAHNTTTTTATSRMSKSFTEGTINVNRSTAHNNSSSSGSTSSSNNNSVHNDNNRRNDGTSTTAAGVDDDDDDDDDIVDVTGRSTTYALFNGGLNNITNHNNTNTAAAASIVMEDDHNNNDDIFNPSHFVSSGSPPPLNTNASISSSASSASAQSTNNTSNYIHHNINNSNNNNNNATATTLKLQPLRKKSTKSSSAQDIDLPVIATTATNMTDSLSEQINNSSNSNNNSSHGNSNHNKSSNSRPTSSNSGDNSTSAELEDAVAMLDLKLATAKRKKSTKEKDSNRSDSRDRGGGGTDITNSGLNGGSERNQQQSSSSSSASSSPLKREYSLRRDQSFHKEHSFQKEHSFKRDHSMRRLGGDSPLRRESSEFLASLDELQVAEERDLRIETGGTYSHYITATTTAVHSAGGGGGGSISGSAHSSAHSSSNNSSGTPSRSKTGILMPSSTATNGPNSPDRRHSSILASAGSLSLAATNNTATPTNGNTTSHNGNTSAMNTVRTDRTQTRFS